MIGGSVAGATVVETGPFAGPGGMAGWMPATTTAKVAVRAAVRSAGMRLSLQQFPGFGWLGCAKILEPGQRALVLAGETSLSFCTDHPSGVPLMA